MDSEFSFNLVKGLHAVTSMQAEVHEDTREIVSCCMYLAMALGGISGALSSRAFEQMMAAGGRCLCCVGLYASYDTWFIKAVTAADEVAASLRERSEYLKSVAHIVNSMSQFTEPSDSMVDTMIGLVKGTVLSWTNLLADWDVVFVLHLIVLLTLVFLNLLYVLGPLMIVGGVFADGLTLRAWGSSLFRVLMWPVFPCFVLVVNGYMNSDLELARDNLSVGIASNIALAIVLLFTPIAVNFLFSRGGVATLGAMGWGLGVGMAAKAVKAVAVGAFGMADRMQFNPGFANGGATPPAAANCAPGYFPRNEKPAIFFPTGGPRAALPPPSPYIGPDGGGMPAWVRPPRA